MHRHTVPRPSLVGLLLAFAAVGASSPTSAAAASFGEPVVISGKDDALDMQVAIAPSGRTAVLYLAGTYANGELRTQWRVAIGDSPSTLGPPTTLKAGQRSADTNPNAQLLARPDGGFVACFPDSPSRGKSVEGCSIAPPGGEFGPLIVVRRLSANRSARIWAAVRPDSSVVLLLTQLRKKSHGRIIKVLTSVGTLSADGKVGPQRSFSRARHENDYNTTSQIVATVDGTVAIPATIPIKGERDAVRPGVRIMPAGSTQFGPVIPLSSEQLTSSIALGGRSDLIVRFATAPSRNSDARDVVRVVRRQPDGTFGRAVSLPGASAGGVYGPVLQLPSGDLLAVTGHQETDPDDYDCYNPVFGQVAVGALDAPGQIPVAPTPLSTLGQIALWPQGAVLDDGTVIAAWVNGANGYGQTRVEARIRAPGASAFGPSQPLAPLSKGEAIALAAGGNHAALAWEIGGYGDPSRIVISDLRAAPPYATSTQLPRYPATNCDE